MDFGVSPDLSSSSVISLVCDLEHITNLSEPQSIYLQIGNNDGNWIKSITF